MHAGSVASGVSVANGRTIALIALFVVLVVALFGLAIIEASLLHLRRSAVAARASDGDERSVRLLTVLDHLPRVMNTVLLTVLFAQVTATTVMAALARQLSAGLGVTVTTVVVTVVLFVYGEAIPKTIAIRDPLRHARRLVGVVQVMDTLLGPFVKVLLWVAELQSPKTAGSGAFDIVTERELRLISSDAAIAGAIERSDAELIERSFRLGDLRTAGVLVPLGDIISVSASSPVDAALDVALGAGHRRLPVHETSPDHLTGFVRLRDLARVASSNPSAPVSDVMRAALHMPVDSKIIDVLRTMQATTRHLALVENADGATVGMITIEDIVEELVGSIREPSSGSRIARRQIRSAPDDPNDQRERDPGPTP